MSGLSVVNLSRASTPRAAFRAIKDAILGKGYGLCLVFTTRARIRKLNLIYRGKDSPTDILSFPLSKTEGEIHICLPEARKESAKFGLPFSGFVPFLFIHGCVHLKGHDHGARMERIEAGFRRRFMV